MPFCFRRHLTNRTKLISRYGACLVIALSWAIFQNGRVLLLPYHQYDSTAETEAAQAQAPNGTSTTKTTRDTIISSAPHPSHSSQPSSPSFSQPTAIPYVESSPNTEEETMMTMIRSFWDRAFQLAVANNRTLAAPMATHSIPGDCPKVYVYNLSSTFRDVTDFQVDSIDFTFGREVQGAKILANADADADDDALSSSSSSVLRETNQYGFGILLQHRIQQPESCYYTSDPHQADLFFLPILTRPKISQTMMSKCQRFNATQLLREIQQEHHNSNTTSTTTTTTATTTTASIACRQFMVLSKGHYKGRPCKGWFWNPVPELQSAMRLAYSHVPTVMGKEPKFVKRAMGDEAIEKQLKHPHLFSVPYPSSLHYRGGNSPGMNNTVTHNNWKRASPSVPTNNARRQRKHLMSFVGSFDHGDVPLRRRIRDSCHAYNDTSICKVIVSPPHQHPTQSARDLLVKQDSVFCLEPVGDSPWRKSLSDSIAFGCIPVLFSNDTDDVAPWFWGSWKKQGRILLGEEYREAFLEGRIDLYQWLRSIPPALLELLQDTLAKYGRQYQYSQTDDLHDGIHVALQGMRDYVHERARQGLCG